MTARTEHDASRQSFRHRDVKRAFDFGIEGRKLTRESTADVTRGGVFGKCRFGSREARIGQRLTAEIQAVHETSFWSAVNVARSFWRALCSRVATVLRGSSNVVQAEPLQRLQHERLTVLGRQLAHGMPQGERLWAGVEVDGLRGNRIKLGFRHRESPALVPAGVLAPQDRRQPTPGGALVLQRIEESPCPQEGLLHEVFRGTSITREPVGVAVQPTAVGVDQLFESSVFLHGLHRPAPRDGCFTVTRTAFAGGGASRWRRAPSGQRARSADVCVPSPWLQRAGPAGTDQEPR